MMKRNLRNLSLALLSVGISLPAVADAQFGTDRESLLRAQRNSRLINQQGAAPSYAPSRGGSAVPSTLNPSSSVPSTTTSSRGPSRILPPMPQVFTARQSQNAEDRYRQNATSEARSLKSAMQAAIASLPTKYNDGQAKERAFAGITDGNWERRHRERINGVPSTLEPQRKGLLEAMGGALGNVANREEQYLSRRNSYTTADDPRPAWERIAEVPTTLTGGSEDSGEGSGPLKMLAGVGRNVAGAAQGLALPERPEGLARPGVDEAPVADDAYVQPVQTPEIRASEAMATAAATSAAPSPGNSGSPIFYDGLEPEVDETAAPAPTPVAAGSSEFDNPGYYTETPEAETYPELPELAATTPEPEAESKSRTNPFAGLLRRNPDTGETERIIDTPRAPNPSAPVSDTASYEGLPEEKRFSLRQKRSLFPEESQTVASEPSPRASSRNSGSAGGGLFGIGRKSESQAVPAGAPLANDSTLHVVTGGGRIEFHAYATDGDNSQPIPINSGTLVSVTKPGEEWTGIRLPSGMEGIIRTRNVRRATADESLGSRASYAAPASKPRTIPSIAPTSTAPRTAAAAPTATSGPPSNSGGTQGGNVISPGSAYSAPQTVPLPDLSGDEARPLGSGILTPLQP